MVGLLSHFRFDINDEFVDPGESFMALKDSVQKKVPCQRITLQPMTEHLVLDNSDTW